MAPPRLILRQQLEIMINYIDQNKILSNGAIQGMTAQKEARQKWAILSKKLNAVPGGVLKTAECWRRYWAEWRYKVRRKSAEIKRYGFGRKVLVPLDDLDMRVLEYCKKSPSNRDNSYRRRSENLIMDESDTEKNNANEEFKTTDNILKVGIRKVADSSKFTNNIVKQEIRKSRESSRNSVDCTSSPPPQWALNLEDRRIAAEERVASALESVAAIMQKQEERRASLEDRMADVLTSLAGTMQDFKSGMREVVQILHHLRPTQPNENNPHVENMFLIE